MTDRPAYPASTGLPTERQPTRGERALVWWRQVLGVRALLRAELDRSKPPQRSGRALLWIQLVLGLAFVPLVVQDTPVSGLIPIALLVLGVGLLVIWSLRSFAVLTQLAVTEVASKAVRAVRASPLPSGAWLTGKLLFLVEGQARGAALLAPIACVGAALTDRSLLDLLALVLVPIVGMPLSVAIGALGLAKSEEPVAARAKGMRQLLKSQAGASNQQAAQLVFIIPFMLFMLMIFAAMSAAPGGPNTTVFGWFTIVFPVFAAISAVAPALSVSIGGTLVPAWVACVALHVAIVPGAWAMARLKLKPGDSPLGVELRLAALLCWGGLAAGLGALLRTSAGTWTDGLVVGLMIVPLGVGFLASAWAGGTSVGDVGEPHARGAVRLVALVRSTAEAHGVAAVVVATAALTLAAIGVGLDAAGATAVIAFLLLPTCVLAAVIGRSARRGAEAQSFEERGPSGGFVGGLALLWILVSIGGVVLLALVQSGDVPAATVPTALLAVADVLAATFAVAPVEGFLAGVGGRAAALPSPVTPLFVGYAGQAAVAAGAWALDRWAEGRWRRWKEVEDEPEASADPAIEASPGEPG